MAVDDGTIRVSNITQDCAMVRNNIGGVKLSFWDDKHRGKMGQIICSPEDIVNTPRHTMGDVTRGDTKDFIVNTDRMYKVYFDAGRDPMGRPASEIEYITGKDIAKAVLSEKELEKQGYGDRPKVEKSIKPDPLKKASENLEFKHIPLRNVSSNPNKAGYRSVMFDEPSTSPRHGSVRTTVIVDVPESAFGPADKHGFVDFTLQKDAVVRCMDAHNGHLKADARAENIYESYYTPGFYQNRYNSKVKLDRTQSKTNDFVENRGLVTGSHEQNGFIFE